MSEDIEKLKRELGRHRWDKEDIIVDVESDAGGKLDAQSRRKKQCRLCKKFPNQAFVEVMFAMVHVFSLLFIPAYFVIGVTLLTWTSSIASVMQDDPKQQIPSYRTSLIGDGSLNIKTFGKAYCIYAIVFLINILFTIKQTFAGRLKRINIHLCINIIGLLLFEFMMWAFARSLIPFEKDTCKLKPFENRLYYLMSWYGITTESVRRNGRDIYLGYEATIKINTIQEALSCCGVYGYEDYLNLNKPEFFPQEARNLGYGPFGSGLGLKTRVISSIPNSCCKAAWRTNVYCAEGIEDPKISYQISRRLNPTGCAEETLRLCDNILYILNIVTIRLLLFRFVLLLIIGLLYIYLKRMLLLERYKSGELLFNMQNPNIPGFDLSEGVKNLKHISSRTQALPGHLYTQLQLERMTSNSKVGKTGEGSGSTLKLSKSKKGNYKNVWEEKQRREDVEMYKERTREYQRKLAELIREEMSEVPDEDEDHHHQHHHHRRRHHEHRHHRQQEGHHHPHLKTITTALSALAPSVSNIRREERKKHGPYIGGTSKALAGLTPYLKDFEVQNKDKNQQAELGEQQPELTETVGEPLPANQKIRYHRYPQHVHDDVYSVRPDFSPPTHVDNEKPGKGEQEELDKLNEMPLQESPVLEKVKTGKERVKTGKERVKTGKERVKTGKEKDTKDKSTTSGDEEHRRKKHKKRRHKKKKREGEGQRRQQQKRVKPKFPSARPKKHIRNTNAVSVAAEILREVFDKEKTSRKDQEELDKLNKLNEMPFQESVFILEKVESKAPAPVNDEDTKDESTSSEDEDHHRKWRKKRRRKKTTAKPNREAEEAAGTTSGGDSSRSRKRRTRRRRRHKPKKQPVTMDVREPWSQFW